MKVAVEGCSWGGAGKCEGEGFRWGADTSVRGYTQSGGRGFLSLSLAVSVFPVTFCTSAHLYIIRSER
jgi:hypothetical protein